MASAPNPAVKAQKAGELKQHLADQWLDRLVYWRMRQVGREPDGDWLVLIDDGADQAKLRVMKAKRWPKAFDRKHRPREQLVGCWVHGHELSLSRTPGHLLSRGAPSFGPTPLHHHCSSAGGFG